MIVDDNQAFRNVLKEVIGQYPQIGKVTEATTAYDMLDQIENEIPDIIIMDVSMPGMDGFEATEELLKKYPSIKVIILTIYDTIEYRTRATESGAIAYIVKQDSVDELDVVLKSIFKEAEFGYNK